MRLINLHSPIDYQPSARNHLIFLPEVDMSIEAIYPEPAMKHYIFTMQIVRAFPSMLKVFRLLLVFIHWPATLAVHALKPLKAPFPKGVRSVLVF